MRRMLGVLRSEDDAVTTAPTTPTEGLRDIDRLREALAEISATVRDPKAGAAADFTFISTAGGAFLEWMEGRTLPGVAALTQNQS